MDNKQKYARIGRWAVVGLVIAVASPLITMMVKGIVGLAIAAVVGFGAIALAPVVGNAFAVWKIKGIKAVARANPVETLQDVYRQKAEALNQFRERIQTFIAEVATFSKQVEQFKVQYPGEAAKFVDHLDKMMQLKDLREAEFLRAKQALTQFDAEIKKADSIWKMGQAAAKVSKSAGFDADDLYERIRTETAVERVESSLNQAFAQLDMALLEQESTVSVGMIGVGQKVGA